MGLGLDGSHFNQKRLLGSRRKWHQAFSFFQIIGLLCENVEADSEPTER